METRIAVPSTAAPASREAVDILLATSQDEFPVVDASGRLSGFLSRADIIEALRASDPGAPSRPSCARRPPRSTRESHRRALPMLASGAVVGVTDGEGRFLSVC